MEKLPVVYAEFEERTAPYRKTAACEPGCSFCCRGPGTVDITTLEGMVIVNRLGCLPKKGRQPIEKAVARDRRLRENNGYAPCPFLQKNSHCRIYDQRPFACRRLYSLKTCSDKQPPLLHKAVMTMAEQSLSRLQRLDDTGYTGHLSYILFMLGNEAFLNTYLAGKFEPERVQDYGRSHGIVINRSVS